MSSAEETAKDVYRTLVAHGLERDPAAGPPDAPVPGHGRPGAVPHPRPPLPRPRGRDRRVQRGAAMRLTVLGCAGSFPGPDSAASGYLVQADDADGRTWTVLLDLGNGALGALQRYGDPTGLDAIGLSHLHADHVADLVVLNVLRRYRPEGPCPPVAVHGPAGTAERLAQMAGKDPATSTDGQFDVRRVACRVAPSSSGRSCWSPCPSSTRSPRSASGSPGRARTTPPGPSRSRTPGTPTRARASTRSPTGVDLLLAEAAFVEGRDDALARHPPHRPTRRRGRGARGSGPAGAHAHPGLERPRGDASRRRARCTTARSSWPAPAACTSSERRSVRTRAGPDPPECGRPAAGRRGAPVRLVGMTSADPSPPPITRVRADGRAPTSSVP